MSDLADERERLAVDRHKCPRIQRPLIELREGVSYELPSVPGALPA